MADRPETDAAKRPRNPLQDWYRYVESLSRPSHRGDDLGDVRLPKPRPWRPWSEVRAESEARRPQETPQERADQFLERLVPRLPSPEELLAEQEYQAPPLLEFAVPELRPPRCEIRIHRLAGFLASARAAEAGIKGGATAAVPTSIEGMFDRAERHLTLLHQLPSDDVTQNSYKAKFRETREELIGRLLDPPLTLEETARLLGVCPTTVRRYTNKGQLRHFRTNGNQRRFRLSDVLEFLELRFGEIQEDAARDAEAATRRAH